VKDLTQRGRENSGEAGPEPRADRRKEKKRKEKGRGARAALGWLAFLAAAPSVAFLATFANAGAGDPSAPDETLFSLLLGLRVSAVSLSAVSLVALGFSVNRLVARRPFSARFAFSRIFSSRCSASRWRPSAFLSWR